MDLHRVDAPYNYGRRLLSSVLISERINLRVEARVGAHARARVRRASRKSVGRNGGYRFADRDPYVARNKE